MALRDLGFDPDLERVYRAVLDAPDIGLAELAALTELDEENLRSALVALSELGVLAVGSGGIAIPDPGLALGQLIERTEDELMARYRLVSGTRSEAALLQSGFSRSPAAPDDHGVERIEGIEQVRERLAELSFFAHRSVFSIQPGGPQSAQSLAASRPLDLRALRRRMDMRVVHETALLADDANRHYLQEMIRNGVLARVTERHIDRLIVFDEEIAVVPIEPGNSRRGALVVRHPGLVAGLLDLFHQVWAAGQDVPSNEGPPPPVEDEITDQDRQVLGLLATGCTDETAARTVGVSVRHLRRRISRLMLALDASSRFEAGVEAGRRGWI